MRKFLCIGFIISFTFTVHAQHISETTQEVILQFSKNFPHIKNVDWDLKDSLIIASYKENNIPTKKAYNLNGKLVFTQLEIDESFLPKSTYDYIARFFKQSRITKAYKVFINSTINYCVVVKEETLYFDIDGNYMKTELQKN